MPRKRFRDELDERVGLGNEIAERELSSEEDLEAARSDYYTWGDYNKEFLRRRFTTPEIAEEYALVLPFVGSSYSSLARDIDDFRERVAEKVRRLESIRERIPLFEESPQAQAARGASVQNSRQGAAIESIFIVHGHADALKLAVHGFLREVTDVEPLILHDQPSRGRTVLEKFEAVGSTAGFAVILLTKDDVGGLSSSDLKPRARQNVVWEFGFFAGALGRSHVAVLYEDGVELPSDLHGLVYIPVDGGGGWKLLLAREPKAVGIAIDADRLI